LRTLQILLWIRATKERFSLIRVKWPVASRWAQLLCWFGSQLLTHGCMSPKAKRSD
jgi:hypothetical protein